MYKKQFTFLLLIGLVMGLFTTTADASDPGRKGFILGIGLGPSFLIPKYKFGNASISLDKEIALMTNFKIGYAPTDQLMIYWSAKSSWYGVKDDLDNKTTFLFGQGGVGASYFFQPEDVSPFVSAGVGYSTMGAPFESDVDSQTGFGLFIGGGYEFARRFIVEGDLIWGNPGEKIGGERASINTLAIGVTVSFLLH